MKRSIQVCLFFLGVIFFWSTQLHASTIDSQLQEVAVSAVEAIISLQASARRDGLGERVVKEDILGKYIPKLKALEKEKNTTLTEVQLEQSAYLRLRDTLKMVTDLKRSQSQVFDLGELEYLNTLVEKKPGLIILKRILREKGLWFEGDPEERYESLIPDNPNIRTDIY